MVAYPLSSIGDNMNEFTIRCLSCTRQTRSGMVRPVHSQWADDLREWTGLTIPDLVCLAQDRAMYRKFVHVVANAR